MPRKSLTASLATSIALLGPQAWAQETPAQVAPASSSATPILSRDEIVQWQAPVRIGQTIRGRLDQGDLRAGNNTLYEEYTIVLNRGALIEIEVQADFRTYIEIYEADSSPTRRRAPRLVSGTDERVSQFEPTGGFGRPYIVRVYGDVADARDYQISFRDATRAVPAPPPITIGQTISSALNDESPQTAASGRFQEFTLAGQPGERVAIEMRSADPNGGPVLLDPYLEVGTYADNGVFRVHKSNDDRGMLEDGTNNLNSYVPVALPGSGQLVVRARGWVRGVDQGPFTLSVERLPPAGDIREPRRLRVGRLEEGALAMTDAMVGPDAFYPFRDYELRGRAGESYDVTVYSNDFPPVVSVGVMSPVGFQTVETGFPWAAEDSPFGDEVAIQRITVNFQQSGALTVRVTAEEEGEVGRFGLIAERASIEAEEAAAP